MGSKGGFVGQSGYLYILVCLIGYLHVSENRGQRLSIAFSCSNVVPEIDSVGYPTKNMISESLWEMEVQCDSNGI